ncbi:hypothetical protein [Gloeobacter violaceus]|uniref:hypothetical protein n=1 Tax=Gloeobacter violaceus TaxID=33072 RepID=UPI0013E8F16C|nr:hypothetical protein [Gloeobacter violaceus]
MQQVPPDRGPALPLRNFRHDPLLIQILDDNHPGAHIDWRISREFALRVLYLALDGGFAGGSPTTPGGVPFGGSGLFGGSTAAAYRFRLTDRLSLTPEVYCILGANNVNQQGLTIGNVRATFEF